MLDTHEKSVSTITVSLPIQEEVDEEEYDDDDDDYNDYDNIIHDDIDHDQHQQHLVKNKTCNKFRAQLLSMQDNRWESSSSSAAHTTTTMIMNTGTMTQQDDDDDDVNDIYEEVIYEEFDNIMDAVQCILPFHQPSTIPRTNIAYPYPCRYYQCRQQQ